MGHDWHHLAAGVMRRIAELADRTAFVDDALPEGGNEENALSPLGDPLAPFADMAEVTTRTASDAGVPAYLRRRMDSDVVSKEQLDPKRG